MVRAYDLAATLFLRGGASIVYAPFDWSMSDTVYQVWYVTSPPVLSLSILYTKIPNIYIYIQIFPSIA